MDMGDFDTKKFKDLKSKWYKKLADTGFDDIEDSEGDIKSKGDAKVIKNALQDKEQRETYYSIAREFLETYNFENDTAKDIWRLHCEGLGKLSIAKELNITAYTAETITVKLRKLAKLRK